jgi:aconitate decarboxylase
MGFTVAVAAKFGRAGINDFTEDALLQPNLLDFMNCVEMVLDEEIDKAFPKERMAQVRITTKDGRVFVRKVETQG